MRLQHLCFLLLTLRHASDASHRIYSKLSCVEFMCARSKILLFTIRGNSGKSAIGEFNTDSSSTSRGAYPQPEGMNLIPELFRSSLLNNLPRAVKQTGSNVIVTEMLKAGRVVAKAVFDVALNVNELDSHNWFDVSRLVQTYPYYWGGDKRIIKADISLSISTLNYPLRSFYIHRGQKMCNIDKGMMGIVENSNDICNWVSEGGQQPVLFYTKEKGRNQGVEEPAVDFADLFLVYLPINIKDNNMNEYEK